MSVNTLLLSQLNHLHTFNTNDLVSQKKNLLIKTVFFKVKSVLIIVGSSKASQGDYCCDLWLYEHNSIQVN